MLLALIDLTVGVSNDAVNFLNSAIGSKAAPRKVILIVASVGVMLGAAFSEGLMGIARSGIFNPAFFSFDQVILIFVAVMLTDIILLDVFNSVGLPTSTTVSIIFELLGASFSIALLYLIQQDRPISELANAINSSGAVVIIAGIFLSVGIAFFAGTIVQFFTRLTFSFRLKKNLEKLGPPFSGLAITTIIYFLLIKGAKGSIFINDAALQWIGDNTLFLLVSSFVGFTVIFFLLAFFKVVHPLKVVVLAGTFALAMAFAGNDLVNFIGVPVASFISFQSWTASGVEASAFNMAGLLEDIPSPAWMLWASGLVMVITLWTSAKSKKVTETEVKLGRQEDGEERFKPNGFSRGLVTIGIALGRAFSAVVPPGVITFIDKRFIPLKRKKKGRSASFDLLRAAVNLLVASALIAYGTSRHLPLSTTFVTFMVAMGSSLADRAWGLDSAVYRVAGVLTVIGGWLTTAIIAFISAATMAGVLFYTGFAGIAVLFVVAIVLLVRSHWSFEEREKAAAVKVPRHISQSSEEFLEETSRHVARQIKSVMTVYQTSVELLLSERKITASLAAKEINQLKVFHNKVNAGIIQAVRKMDNQNLAAGKLSIQLFNITQDLSQSIDLVFSSVQQYRVNLHPMPSKAFAENLKDIEQNLSSFLKRVNKNIQTPATQKLSELKASRDAILNQCEAQLEQQVMELQRGKIGNRLALLQTKILLETKDIAERAYQLADTICSYVNKGAATEKPAAGRLAKSTLPWESAGGKNLS